MVLSETRGLSLFLVIREGLGYGVRLPARGQHKRLRFALRLSLEPDNRLGALFTPAALFAHDGGVWSLPYPLQRSAEHLPLPADDDA